MGLTVPHACSGQSAPLTWWPSGALRSQLCLRFRRSSRWYVKVGLVRLCRATECWECSCWLYRLLRRFLLSAKRFYYFKLFVEDLKLTHWQMVRLKFLYYNKLPMYFLLPCRLCLRRTLSGRHLVSSSYLTTTTSSSSTIIGKLALPAKRCQKTPRSALFVAPSCVSKAHAANSRVPVNAFWWAFQHTRWQLPDVCVCFVKTYCVLQHSQHCGAATGIFLLINASVIIIIRGHRFCLWGSVYLDAHGEEDRDLRYVSLHYDGEMI